MTLKSNTSMANSKKDNKFLGIKKETLLKVAGYGAIGILAIGLIGLVL